MKIYTYIDSLVSYAMNNGLAEPVDHQVLTNRLLDLLRLDSYEPSDEPQSEDLEEILSGILDYAVANGLCDDGITARDIFDTRIMGAVTPMPREVIRTFREKYAVSPVEATDWYYQLSCNTDYIRRYRIKKDMRWKYASEYGEMDITINLSKPEKDPKAIAAAKNAPRTPIPSASSAGRTRATQAGSTTPPGPTTGSSPSRSAVRTGACSIPPMSTITSTASSSTPSTFP